MRDLHWNAAQECRARMLNINMGHNRELMERCRRLADYAYFVSQVRYYLEHGYDLRKAADRAVDECIKQGKLTDILSRNRSEVINMLMTTYDRKRHMKMVLEEGREEGYEKGLSDGEDRVNQLILRLIEDERTDDLKRAVSDKAFQEQLFQEYNIK